MMQASIVAVPGGTVIYDALLPEPPTLDWFERAHWQLSGQVTLETSGRGAVLVIDRGEESWVLRHYRRGGVVARLIDDHYLWLGLERSRAFREWRLLARLHDAGLPVPKPVAAAVRRTGVIYTADLLTVYLAGTRKLSAYLAEATPPQHCWENVGRMVAAVHRHGVDHPDLTAHNILLDEGGEVFLVDFDNAAVKPPGGWQRNGLERLQRSLRKVALETGTQFDAAAWQRLVDAYGRALPA